MRPVLDGVRGEPPRDIGAFCDMVASLSRLIADQVDVIAEIDVNPVILHAEDGMAVDALVVRAE